MLACFRDHSSIRDTILILELIDRFFLGDAKTSRLFVLWSNRDKSTSIVGLGDAEKKNSQQYIVEVFITIIDIMILYWNDKNMQWI